MEYDSSPKGSYILLDATIFYPQGGGQPFDSGTVRKEDLVFSVHFVELVDGKVRHYIKDEERSQLHDELVGQEFRLSIDREKRVVNAKCHTAGHLLADIVEDLVEELKCVKGYHFPDGPHMVFSGKLCSLAKEDLISSISEIAKKKIEEGAVVTIKEASGEEGMQAPKDGRTRLVQIQGYRAGPCGGTHVRSLGELKELTIRKIVSSKGGMRICYQVV